MIRDHQTYYNGLHIHQPYYFPPSGRCVDLVTCHLPFQLFVECNLERTIDPSAVTPISSEKGNAHKTALQFSCLGIFDSTSRQTSFLAPETDLRGSVSGQSALKPQLSFPSLLSSATNSQSRWCSLVKRVVKVHYSFLGRAAKCDSRHQETLTLSAHGTKRAIIYLKLWVFKVKSQSTTTHYKLNTRRVQW